MSTTPYPIALPNSYYRGLVTSEYQGPIVETTGVLQFGSPIITSVGNTQGIQIGSLVTGEGIPPAATVTSISGNTIVISGEAFLGYPPAVVAFGFDSVTGTFPVIAGFDSGEWTSYSGSTNLTFFAAPAPRMQAWLTANLQLGQGVGACLQQFDDAFNLETAVGTQLDTLGVILGQSRAVPVLTATVVTGGTGYSVGETITALQTSAGGMGMTFSVTSVVAGAVTGIVMLTPGTGYALGEVTTTASGGGTGLTLGLSYLTLGDADYRTLLRCTVVKNHWNGQVSNIPNVCIVNSGSGYSVGGVIFVLQPQASGLTISVTSVTTGGRVSAVSVTSLGHSYQPGTCLTSGGSGVGLTVYLPFGQSIAGGYDTGTLQQVWSVAFPPGSGTQISVQDNAATSSYNAATVMSAQVKVSFGINTSTAMSVLTVNGYLVPRPQGVNYSYNVVVQKFPIFTFDQNTSQYAGFDLGNFSA